MAEYIIDKQMLFVAQKILLLAVEMSIRTPMMPKKASGMQPIEIVDWLTEEACKKLKQECEEML